MQENFGAKDKFAWFEKSPVNGRDAREVYCFLKRQLSEEDGTKDISWNFAKFLVDHEGRVVKRYRPNIDPEKIIPDIEKLLKRKEASEKK